MGDIRFNARMKEETRNTSRSFIQQGDTRATIFPPMKEGCFIPHVSGSLHEFQYYLISKQLISHSIKKEFSAVSDSCKVTCETGIKKIQYPSLPLTLPEGLFSCRQQKHDAFLFEIFNPVRGGTCRDSTIPANFTAIHCTSNPVGTEDKKIHVSFICMLSIPVHTERAGN